MCVFQVCRCMCVTESTTACCPSLSKLSRMWRMKAKVLYTPSQRLWVSTHTYAYVHLHTQTHGPTVMSSLSLWLILLSGLFLLLLDLYDPSWLHPFNSFWLIPPPPHCLLFPLSVFHPPLALSFLFSFFNPYISPAVTIQRKSRSWLVLTFHLLLLSLLTVDHNIEPSEHLYSPLSPQDTIGFDKVSYDCAEPFIYLSVYLLFISFLLCILCYFICL